MAKKKKKSVLHVPKLHKYYDTSGNTVNLLLE